MAISSHVGSGRDQRTGARRVIFAARALTVGSPCRPGLDGVGGAAVLVGQPVRRQVEVDARRGDRAVPGLDLQRLDGHARLPQPGEAGVTKLVAGAPGQPRPSPGAGEDLVEALRRQRLPAPWSLEHDEEAVGGGIGGALVVEVGGDGSEEGARHRNDAVVAALAVDHEHPPLAQSQILEPQPEHLAATQPAEQHRLDHRPVPLRAQGAHERLHFGGVEDAGQAANAADERGTAELPTGAPRRQAPRDGVGADVAPGEQVAIEARHRGQAPLDRRRRQPARSVGDAKHVLGTGPSPAL